MRPLTPLDHAHPHHRRTARRTIRHHSPPPAASGRRMVGAWSRPPPTRHHPPKSRGVWSHPISERFSYNTGTNWQLPDRTPPSATIRHHTPPPAVEVVKVFRHRASPAERSEADKKPPLKGGFYPPVVACRKTVTFAQLSPSATTSHHPPTTTRQTSAISTVKVETGDRPT